PYCEDPVHEEYKSYEVPYVFSAEDKKENILIVPEVISQMQIINQYQQIRKVIWWLSVDNYYSSRKNLISEIIKKFGKFVNVGLITIDPLVKSANLHLAQSFYAYKHLILNGIDRKKVFYLSDYINQQFLMEYVDYSIKKDIVAFNPKKGFEFTKLLIEQAEGIEFVPIINMSRQEVIDLLKKAKVYIDFGNHPGKDRIPREAAILGCCVITGKRGSAGNSKDVPIPREFKFDDRPDKIPFIIEKIKDCFTNYRENFEKQSEYRKI
ncbi:MAG: hypothetical protein WHT47_01345, partial [Hydrogenothermaceae bacterium]